MKIRLAAVGALALSGWVWLHADPYAPVELVAAGLGAGAGATVVLAVTIRSAQRGLAAMRQATNAQQSVDTGSPQLRLRWHVVLRAITPSGKMIVLRRGPVEWPASDPTQVAAEVVSRWIAKYGTPEGTTLRAAATPITAGASR